MLKPLSYLHQFMHRPLPFMHQLWQKQGDRFPVWLGPKKFHFIYHPDMAAEILCHRANNYQKSRLIFNKIKPITGNSGLVQLKGEQWKEMRKLTNQLFFKQELVSYLPIIEQYANLAINQIHQKIDAKMPVDMANLMIEYTLNTIIKIVTGLDNVSEQSQNIAAIFIALNRECGKKLRTAIDLPLWIPSKQNVLIRQLRQQLELHINQLLQCQQPHDGFNSLLKLLVDKLGIHSTQANQLIIDQLTTFLFAGFETTATSLAFSLYLIARHPSIQEKIYLEAKQYFDKDQPLTLESIKALEYTTAVYRESLRLYPPAWILAREVVNTETFNGYRFKKGDNILVSIRSMHRHPAIWNEPNKFKPERFYQNQEWPGHVHKFAFIPFGVGERICSGTQLAMLEAVYVLAKLVATFNFQTAETTQLKTEAMITLHPAKEILLVAKRREDESRNNRDNKAD